MPTYTKADLDVHIRENNALRARVKILKTYETMWRQFVAIQSPDLAHRLLKIERQLLKEATDGTQQ